MTQEQARQRLDRELPAGASASVDRTQRLALHPGGHLDPPRLRDMHPLTEEWHVTISHRGYTETTWGSDLEETVERAVTEFNAWLAREAPGQAARAAERPAEQGSPASSSAAAGPPDPPPLPQPDPPIRQPTMSWEAALRRLGEQLPEEAFATVRLGEVAVADRLTTDDLRAGRPARVTSEWAVTVTAPGYNATHGGDELAPVVEQALADFRRHREGRDAEAWARDAVPDKPPRLTAPSTAESKRQQRGKDAG